MSACEYYMRMAIEQACKAKDAGEVPIGAVVVYNPIDRATRKPLLQQPKLIAKSYNNREMCNNPAGHAEFSALLQASKHLDTWRLTGCTVYVTLEPCLMCAGLMHQARIDCCVYGASDPKAGALGSLYKINEDNRLNHTFKVHSGVMQQECSLLLKEFFRSKRSGD